MANHQKAIAAEETPRLPLVTWIALVRVGEDDYRVVKALTEGIPTTAEVGERSLDTREAEERFRVAAADILDCVDVVPLPLPQKLRPQRDPQAEARAHNLAIDQAIASLSKLKRPA